jgi:hypothetical protein
MFEIASTWAEHAPKVMGQTTKASFRGGAEGGSRVTEKRSENMAASFAKIKSAEYTSLYS